MKNLIKNALILPVVGLVLTACNAENGTDISNLSLAQGSLTLYCQDVAIKDDTCILNDPSNPYKNSLVNDETKWDLNDTAPSALSRFYLWATAQAQAPSGENQYYAAKNLHDMFNVTQDIVAQAQAKRAYKSVLDNYYDSLSYYTGDRPLDLVPDTDFNYSDWGSGSALEGNFTGDEDYEKVFQVTEGGGWGAQNAAIAFTNLTAGFSDNYENLVFKVKNLPSTDVFVKFSIPGTSGSEQQLALSAYATAIADTTDWFQVTVPMSLYSDSSTYTEFGILGGWQNGGTFLITDIGFTGDATGTGLVGDKDGDGFISMYYPGTTQLSFKLRDSSGADVYNIAPFANLYGGSESANAAITSWGYTYDPVTQTISQ